ncbi:MAG: O-antigen ligase family protein [Anaerolineae bacterium]|nr:O-antigen ligase family protein [Anaerolineae bacterium]
MAIKPVHVALLLVYVIAIFSFRFKAWGQLFQGYSAIFILLRGMYSLWYVLSLAWSNDISTALPIVIKDIIYFGFFLIFTILVTDLVQNDKFIEIAGLASTIGVLVFVAYFIFVFHRLGRNLYSEYYRAIISMDINALMRSFYPTIFNFSLTGNPVETVFLTSLRNTVMGTFIIYMILLSIWKNTLKNNTNKILVFAIIVLCVVLVLTSVSRSNIIVLGVSLFLPFFIRAIHKKKYRKKKIQNFFAILAIAVTTLFVFFISDISQWDLFLSLANVLYERLSAITTDPRLLMYKETFAQISNHILLGSGIGVQLQSGEFGSGRIHNVFLSSWIETGLVGMVLSLAWYLSIIIVLLKTIISHKSWQSNISRDWVTALPILPLLRALVSGGGGFTLIEWLALALFFGISNGIKQPA